ncbi:MAG: hypothetical protein K1Y36_25750 [Blastocatellia bacterium]|nr:hypothetical protein [Blastocatellia bacterium]
MPYSFDQYFLPSHWEQVQLGAGTQPSLTDQASPTLPKVQQLGMWLQLVSADPDDLEWMSKANEVVLYLDKLAALDEFGIEDYFSLEPSRLRLAAAYHLWPFYCRKYYTSRQCVWAERLNARQKLCEIQRLLFANVRATLDFLRLSFGVTTDEELIPYLVLPDQRSLWRHQNLLPPQSYPDLCAIDSLAQDMVQMERAMPLLHRLTYFIHRIAMGWKTTKAQRQRIMPMAEGLRLLGIASLAIIHEVDGQSSSEAPHMVELVHAALEKEQDLLNRLIPFHVMGPENRLDQPDLDAESYRKLANAIFSCDPATHPLFSLQRGDSINKIIPFDLTSSGKQTEMYLRGIRQLHPKAGLERSQKKLNDLVVPDIPDWSDSEFWWEPMVPNMTFLESILGSAPSLHANHHASALWDFLASPKSPEEPPHTPEGLAEWVTTQPSLQSFDPLPEILLRRNEIHTRTSFRFGVSRTFPESSSKQPTRLLKFVSGTFLGLERPGIPYEVERFRRIAHRFHGTILSLAECCALVVARQEEKHQQRQQRRRIRILELLQGKPYKDSTCPQRGEGFPFAHSVYPHSPHKDEVQGLPLVYKLKRILKTSSRQYSHNFSIGCVRTLKALFYIFEGSCAETEGSLRWHVPRPVSRFVECKGCLTAILHALVVPPQNLNIPKIEIRGSAKLPSFPGIRFLIALADFFQAVANEYEAVEQRSWVEKIELQPNKLIISWSSDFPAILENRFGADTRLGQVTGALENFRNCLVNVSPANVDPRITQLLTSENFRSKLDRDRTCTAQTMIFSWKEESNVEH